MTRIFSPPAVFGRLALSLFPVLLPEPGRSDEIVITLDTVAVSNCNETWREGGCLLQFAPANAGQCPDPGICTFTPAQGEVFLDCILAGLIDRLQEVERVEIDIVKGQEAGCVRAELYGGKSMVDMDESSYFDQGGEPLVLEMPVAGTATSFTVKGSEAVIQEVRLSGPDLVSSSNTSWGLAKALFGGRAPLFAGSER